MINILHQSLSAHELASYFPPERPRLLPALGDERWRLASANPRVAALALPLVAQADRERAEALPPITDEMYAHAFATGERLPFENVYFERRRRLARAAVALALADEADRAYWTESLVSKLRDVFQEAAWALPAHMPRDGGRDPSTIDLFASETVNLMAEMVTVFARVLPPDLIDAIRIRLRRDTFTRYAAWPDDGLWCMRLSSNWNAVCHQGVIGGALGIETDSALIGRLLAATAANLPLFLSGFAADGGCSEGPGYWSYGFGWFCVLNEQLETASGGALSFFEGDEKVREIAGYLPRVTLANGYVAAFADSPQRLSVNPRLAGYLGKRLGMPVMTSMSLASYRALLRAGITGNDERCDWFYIARLLLEMPVDLGDDAPPALVDSYLPELEVFCAHKTAPDGALWELAAKGGHNAEHHNHNDCGSYIFNLNGKSIACEIGYGEYVLDFFGPGRYQFLVPRTLGHSLPIVNGCEQADGPERRASKVRHSVDAATARFSVEIASAYPPEASCKRLLRELALDVDAGLLTVRDSFELDDARSLETAVIADAPVTQEGAIALVHSGGEQVAVSAAEGSKLARIERHSYSDHGGRPREISRIVFAPEQLDKIGCVGYSFTRRSSAGAGSAR